MAAPVGLRNTFLAGIIGNMAALMVGSSMGWMSPTQTKLEAPDAFLPLTGDQLSWVGSLLALGTGLGPIPAGILADRIGRKWTLLGLAVPFLLGWLLEGLAEACLSVELMYAGRLVQGIGNGAVFTVVPMYSGEIAEDSIRGALGSFLQLFITAAYVYEYSIGPFVPYWVLVVLSAIIPAIWAVAMFFMPGSPYFLLAKGRKEQAVVALRWLRGTHDVDKEVLTIQEAVEESQRSSGSLRNLVATRGTKKALILGIGLVVGQQLSGVNAVLFYTANIFEMTGSSLSADVSTIIVGVVMFLSALATPLLIDRLGRRPILLISAIGMAAGQIILGTYFFMYEQDKASVKDIDFLPVLSLMLYVIAFSFGFGALPWAVMGELFPSNIKAIATSLTASFCWLLAFVITKFFSNLADVIGMSYTFWMFGVFCIMAGLFVFFWLPETKSKSLQEIQDILNR
ncbi:facilitated trehalose transporter Tret1 [Anabrus simplex]|uniref:facilitated trehalose transporter Tret1 n=1 Tax=Anabrus simplex TaxID=316456 RepID=UPI0035A2E859